MPDLIRSGSRSLPCRDGGWVTADCLQPPPSPITRGIETSEPLLQNAGLYPFMQSLEIIEVSLSSSSKVLRTLPGERSCHVSATMGAALGLRVRPSRPDVAEVRSFSNQLTMSSSCRMTASMSTFMRPMPIRFAARSHGIVRMTDRRKQFNSVIKPPTESKLQRQTLRGTYWTNSVSLLDIPCAR